MSTPAASDLVLRLNELLTRSVYSAAGYVFEAEPYTVEAKRRCSTPSTRFVRRTIATR